MQNCLGEHEMHEMAAVLNDISHFCETPYITAEMLHLSHLDCSTFIVVQSSGKMIRTVSLVWGVYYAVMYILDVPMGRSPTGQRTSCSRVHNLYHLHPAFPSLDGILCYHQTAACSVVHFCYVVI